MNYSDIDKQFHIDPYLCSKTHILWCNTNSIEQKFLTILNVSQLAKNYKHLIKRKIIIDIY